MSTSKSGLAASDAMLELLSAVIPAGDKAVYVSAPITSGRRFLDWWVAGGRNLDRESDAFRQAHEAEVVEDNVRAVAPLVQRVRDAFDRPVIDPTRLPDVDGWAQPDYHRFWVRVIRRYAGTVVLADGWAYSTGCVMEATAAAEDGVELLDADLRPLDGRAATECIHDAIRDLRAADLDVEHLRIAAEAFERHQLATATRTPKP